MATPDPQHLEFNFPEWTEYQLRSGLDPLGMQNTSVNLYQSLVPGISNVTLRMRYYGLYAWLCRTYARRDGSEDPERWKRYVRRAEALYALTTHHAGGTYGVAGTDWASKAYQSTQGNTIDFAAAADPGSETPYLQQAWGAYGAAYRSQLYETEVFWQTDTHSLPVPSKAIGDRLADAFEESLGETAPLLADIIGRGSVHLDELDRLQAMLPFNIDIASTERAAYQDLLFAEHDPDGAGGRSRRLTILLILSVTGLLARPPGPNETRWIFYAGQDAGGRSLAIPGEDQKEQCKNWWLYHANDLCHLALETLLKFLLDNLAVHPNGIMPQRLIATCVDRLCESVDTLPATWSELVGGLSPAANPYGQDNASSEWSLAREIMSRAGRDDASDCPAETAWSAIVLLGILYRRAQTSSDLVSTTLAGVGTAPYQNLLTESRFLDRHDALPLRELLTKLFEQRILQRHLWVAARKFQHGDYTFLVESDEGRIRLRRKDGPIMTNPRLGPTVQFLRDIHLIRDDGLTDLGREALAQA
ncbi:MAG: hypothetical protein FKY71_10410 [Spiribacter salinus]|uniref:Uncharacterized protein n=1 Tax=Spiribacter salinus TaxID=1335746 RepID=A0A540VSG9_9GAMM|nr:MAG: hypothetical protein FKY71_10410 [Spiribacter salinus]